jgi:dephospho-CoA kinase
MSKLILGIAGEIGSGKGTIAKYLSERHNASSYQFSMMLRDVLDRLHLEHSRDNIQRLSTTLRHTFGEDLMARVMAEDVKGDESELIVIDGVRRIDDIKYLKEIPEFKLVYVEADMKIRYDRLIHRNENVDDEGKTFEEFEKDHQRETEVTIRGLKDHSGIVLENNESLEEFYEKLDEMVK